MVALGPIAVVMGSVLTRSSNPNPFGRSEGRGRKLTVECALLVGVVPLLFHSTRNCIPMSRFPSGLAILSPFIVLKLTNALWVETEISLDVWATLVRV